jgi:hypothetical protein
MSDPAKSYLDVQYDLRPAKQVERRMLIDILMSLMSSGFPLQEYQYTGFGSVYFVDFILLHRYLGMSKLQSVEHDLSIEKRVHFNRPFAPVRIRMSPIGDIIPELNNDINHVLWLDFDDRISSEILSDVVLAAYQLSVGSILLVTVDVEPPSDGQTPAQLMAYHEEHAGEFFEHEWSASNFSPSKLPETVLRIVKNAIFRGLTGRENVGYQQLVKFIYADGHEMITLGGMIVTEQVRQRVLASGLEKKPFVLLDANHDLYRIKVPRLTRKERLHLDGFMPCPDDWVPDAFEMSSEEVLSYRDIYRYHPAYAELLL